jgi:NAD(P)-dependent dehydrogenase (short-subunit alcohol dehydrogenase family)
MASDAPLPDDPAGHRAGRHALVTGGGTGIGLACARQLLQAGWHVTIAGRRASVLDDAAAALRATPGVAGPDRVRTAVCDVTDDEQVRATVLAACHDDGRIGATVVNAGAGAGTAVLQMQPAELRAILELNVVGAFSTIRHAARVMQPTGGSIVAISSIAGVLGGRFRAAYAASKAALDMLVKVSADELGPFGIRVNSVRPGLVPSDATASLFDPQPGSALAEVQRDYLRNMPLGRLGTPDDVGALVRFLCSDDAAWITGQHYAVDGGHTLRRAPNMDAAIRDRLGDAAVDDLVGPRWE